MRIRPGAVKRSLLPTIGFIADRRHRQARRGVDSGSVPAGTALPQGTRREIEQFERVRFLFHFLFLLAPRVSEVASHSMNSFREFRGKWWWFVEGKGGKRAKVPVNDEMLDALMRYRRFLGLDDLPQEDDTSPIFRSIKGTSGK